GIIRDVLAREVPMVLRTEIYATACIVGGILHTAALQCGVAAQTAMLLGLFTTLGIRLAAIRWHLKLPTFRID
ncbi:MAG: TRIC cation channel family protein, partial [Plesiomonas sp.]